MISNHETCAKQILTWEISLAWRRGQLKWILIIVQSSQGISFISETVARFVVQIGQICLALWADDSIQSKLEKEGNY